MTSDEIRELGRAIGFDMAAHGVELWPKAAGFAGVEEGFRLRKSVQSRRYEPEHRAYVRKWLQLRVNALERRTMFDSDVDATFLEEIDCPDCPVTLVPFTRSERAETDWSIDRVNNNGAYAIGNLIVLSTKVNKAKGDKTIEEVLDRASAIDATEGLSGIEWMRLASLMLGACTTDDPRLSMRLRLMPLATRIPNKSFRHFHQELQWTLLLGAQRFENYRILQRAFSKLRLEAHWPRAEAIIAKIKRRLASAEYPFDAMISSDIQRKRLELMAKMTDDEQGALRRIVHAAIGGTPAGSEVDSWALSTDGKLS